MKNIVRHLKTGLKYPRGFGVRRPSAAMGCLPCDWKSGSGLPPSKTPPRRSLVRKFIWRLQIY